MSEPKKSTPNDDWADLRESADLYAEVYAEDADLQELTEQAAEGWPGSERAASPFLRVVRLTPAGRGAVATLLVDGPGARGVVGSLFRAKGGHPLGSPEPERLVFGRFGSAREDAPGDEVVVRCHGAERVEVHCHGGCAAAAMIQRRLLERGCRAIDWPQWVAADHADPIAAAALRGLAEARTRRTAAILLDQYHGTLGRAFDAIQRNLERGETSAAFHEIDALLGRAPLGRHLARPWLVAVAGPPNVGKSTLVNALLGYTRAITHTTPGTTRDVVAATTAIDGWPVELFDTAGLRAGRDPIERAGIEQAESSLAKADLVLWVVDRSQPPKREDYRQNLRGVSLSSTLEVHNKCDLPPAVGEGRPPGIAVSALRAQGIDVLLDAVSERLVPAPPPSGAAVPFDEGHVERLQRLRRRAITNAVN